jgi:type IV pilus assembly protein PilV
VLNMTAPRRLVRPPYSARGFTLLEVLVALLVFSFGVLALVGLQASALRLANDARDRGTATFLADQLLGRMLISDPTAANAFSHMPVGNTPCNPDGAASTHPVITAWLQEVAAQLPQADADYQQVVVNPANGQVRVTLCWQPPGGTAHSLTVANQVQWQ